MTKTGTEAATGGARMYLKGFPLKREPDSVDFLGRPAFSVIDWAESANKVFKFVHGDIRTADSDRRYEEVMRARMKK